jgi:hypothetical protein
MATALAYNDGHKRLKALVPIREYMQRSHPLGNHIIGPLFKYFQELLKNFTQDSTTSSGPVLAQITANYRTFRISSELGSSSTQQMVFIVPTISADGLAEVHQ